MNSEPCDYEKCTKLAALTRERDEAVHQRNNLLARIHRDGGHYTTFHGVVKSVADADTIVSNHHERIAALEVLLGACSLEIRKSAESSIYALADNIDRALAGEKQQKVDDAELMAVVEKFTKERDAAVVTLKNAQEFGKIMQQSCAERGMRIAELEGLLRRASNYPLSSELSMAINAALAGGKTGPDEVPSLLLDLAVLLRDCKHLLITTYNENAIHLRIADALNRIENAIACGKDVEADDAQSAMEAEARSHDEAVLREMAHDIEADAATMLHAINITLSVAFDPACVQASVEIQKAADALASGKEINSKKILIHKHTDECLEYAAKTGKAICIVECRDSYKELIK
jgi:hypothetical protein